MLDNYFNDTAELLFSRFKPDQQDWARMVIEVLKKRFPQADHWTAGGKAFNFIYIGIGRKKVGKKSGLPVFYIRQEPTSTGPTSLLVSRRVLASGEHQEINRDNAPGFKEIIDWLDKLELQFKDEARRRLAGGGKNPIDFTNADKARKEQRKVSKETTPAQQMSAVPPQALNRILYGPPGTGKTYRTTHEALSIIERVLKPAGDPAEQKLRFDKLRREGYIAFVTFHQSFSYEDFIEGIRAEAVGGQLSYEVRDGIFKRMAMAAMYREPTSAATSPELDFDTLHDAFTAEVEGAKTYQVWSATGVELAIVGVDSKGTLQVTHATSARRHNVSRARLRKLYEVYPDTAVLPKRNAVEAITSVIGSVNYTVYWAVLSGLLAYKEASKAQLEESRGEILEIDEPLEYAKIKKRILDDETLIPNGKRYVLIIDEINRGNMSRIFGELITLIEASKRAGGPETVEVQLPYSKERFSVPNNLYVIGTMNTADRSLAVVDTALRRRFDFIEMMPDLGALAQKTVGGVDIAHMLHAINLRIEQLYDREHMIGHAFFMGLANDATIDDLAHVFKNNVLPLLEEYFYEDWEKINKVLGDCGIYTSQQPGDLGFAHKAAIWRRDEGSLMLPATYHRIYASVKPPRNTRVADSDG